MTSHFIRQALKSGYIDAPRTRHVTSSCHPNADKELCVVEAISAWRTRIMRTGRTLGPLFVRLDDRGQLSNVDTKLTSVAVASIIENAVMPANVKHLPQLTPQTYISEY